VNLHKNQVSAFKAYDEGIQVFRISNLMKLIHSSGLRVQNCVFSPVWRLFNGYFLSYKVLKKIFFLL